MSWRNIDPLKMKPLDNMWKVVLSEDSDDKSNESNPRRWFARKKDESRTEGDSYDDLETKVERVFDSIFYEPEEDEEDDKRCGLFWSRKSAPATGTEDNNRESEKASTQGKWSFAPPGPSAPGPKIGPRGFFGARRAPACIFVPDKEAS